MWEKIKNDAMLRDSDVDKDLDDVAKYDVTASSYDELYRGEQYSKYSVLVGIVNGKLNSSLVLDAGCGTGLLLEYLRENNIDKYARYICLDPSTGMIERLAGKNIDHRVIPVVGYAEEIPVRDSSIDIVVSITTWSNIADKEKAVNEFIRVTKENGLIVVSKHLKHNTIPPSLINKCFKEVVVHIDAFYTCKPVNKASSGYRVSSPLENTFKDY